VTQEPSDAGRGEAVKLVAADGYALAAFRYRPASEAARARLIVAGATGVPQGFYRRFAEYACQRGFDTLTLDYRGVGLSAPPSLRGFKADFLDWGRLDLAAAAQTMQSAELPLFMVGHSYGGHGFGLMPNHHLIRAFYGFGVGAGWHGWMPLWEQVRVLAMWHVVAPLLVRWKGYLAWGQLGMGADLPVGVYRQWKRWCGYPHYFFDDPEMRAELASFAAVRAPILAANALDDPWAPPKSRDAFMAGYSGTPWQGLDIDPKPFGQGGIGHMGYFRASAQPLWDDALRWFDEHRSAG
jgi:predicted alpha/beta hydrolase